jgi:drug/metabolite transporter (DMT)-like permease
MNNSTPESSSHSDQTQEETKRSRYLLGFVLLAGVSLILGSGFPIIKEVERDLSPQLITTSRYVIAALVLSPLLSNLNRLLIRDGTIIGLLFFALSLLECVALEDISASRGGFTFALSIIFITLLEILQGKSLPFASLYCAAMAFAGIALMSWQSGEPLIGSIWMILAAILDAAYIIVVEGAVRVHRPLQLAAVSCWIPAILGLIWSAPNLANEWTAITDNIWGLLYLGGVAIALATVLENIGQQWVPGNEVAIFRTLEPLAAAFLSFWLLGETFSLYDSLGAVMILSGIILLIFLKGDSENLPNPEVSPSSEEERKSNLQP